MASVDTPAPEPEKVAEAATSEPEKVVVVEAEAEKAAPPPPPPEVKGDAEAPPSDYFALADLVLRFLLFASGLVAVVVIVTGNQTETVSIPFPPFRASVPAKFNHSPALIYFVAALSVAGLYGIITTLLSFYAVLKPGCYPKVLSHFVILDVLLLGIVAAATGAAGGVGYVGLRGNSHVRWTKICNVYDEFCRHLAGSLAASLFGSIVLTLLILLSIYSLSKKIPK